MRDAGKTRQVGLGKAQIARPLYPSDKPLRVLDLRTAPGVRDAGAEVTLPQEEDGLVDCTAAPLTALRTA